MDQMQLKTTIIPRIIQKLKHMLEEEPATQKED